MRLLTPRLALRPVAPGDRDDLHRLEQDPEVMRYLNGGLPTPLAPDDPDASPYRMPRGHETDVWAVTARDRDALAGWVAMHIDGATGEIGYRFFRTSWGLGFATEASRALVSHAFEHWGLERVIARTMAVNAASRRVMEKLGMRHTETCHPAFADPLAGAASGDVTYEIDRAAWRDFSSAEC